MGQPTLPPELQQLPVFQHIEEILDVARCSQIVSIKTGTGLGKTTIVPLALAYGLTDATTRVLVSLPLRSAVIQHASFLAKITNTTLGQEIGYVTGFERESSSQNLLRFTTDGCALRYILQGHFQRKFGSAGRPYCLVLDEFHMRRLATDITLAYAVQNLCKDPNFRLIIMSATLNQSEIENFLGPIPFINIEGNMFPVKKEEPGPSEEDDVLRLARMLKPGEKGAWLLPGKAEIADAIIRLKAHRLDAILLPMHSKLPRTEQLRIFDCYSKPVVILATDAIESSHTIPGLKWIVDSCLRRQLEATEHGTALYTVWASEAQLTQCMGRLGRLVDGTYIAHRGDNQRDFVRPEVDRCPLHGVLLHIIVDGRMHPDRLKMMTPFNRVNQKRAMADLQAWGLVDRMGFATPDGVLAANLPLSPDLAKFVITSHRNWGLGYDAAVAAASADVGGFADGHETGWRDLIDDQETSDILAQIDLFYETIEAMEDKDVSQGLHGIGVDVSNIMRAKEIAEKVSGVLGKLRRPISSTRRMDQQHMGDLFASAYLEAGAKLFLQKRGRGRSGWCSSSEPHVVRQLVGSSVVSGASIIAGKTFDFYPIEGAPRRRIVLATEVSEEQVAKRLPTKERFQLSLCVRDSHNRSNGHLRWAGKGYRG